MEIPPIHVCQALTTENEVIKSKYDKLKKKFKELHEQMLEMKENLMRLQMEKEYCTRSEKKEIILAQSRVQFDRVKTDENKKDSTSEKLLTLNNKLIKQFEKGNKQQQNTEKKLLKIENENEKLKSDLFEASQQIEFLRKQMEAKDDKFQIFISKIKAMGQSKQEYSGQISNVKKENKKLVIENKKLKGELKGLDESFFEEIEDMKYALQQSAKLNTEYERALRRICKQFGLNYNSAVLLSRGAGEQKFQNRKKQNKFVAEG